MKHPIKTAIFLFICTISLAHGMKVIKAEIPKGARLHAFTTDQSILKDYPTKFYQISSVFVPTKSEGYTFSMTMTVESFDAKEDRIEVILNMEPTVVLSNGDRQMAQCLFYPPSKTFVTVKGKLNNPLDTSQLFRLFHHEGYEDIVLIANRSIPVLIVLFNERRNR